MTSAELNGTDLAAVALRLGEPVDSSLTELVDEVRSNFKVVVTEARWFEYWRSVLPRHVRVVTSQRELKMLSVGRICEANGSVRSLSAGEGQYLARVAGVVERGDDRGRLLGFPTANIAISTDANPPDGVYAAWYRFPTGEKHAAALNVGRRPTFYADRGLRLAEAHLLDFEGDLYGQRAEVFVVAHVRDEMRFEGVEPLVAQLRADITEIRRLLSGDGST